MIGAKQELYFYTKNTNLSTSTVESIYSSIKNENDECAISLLNEDYSLIPCKIVKKDCGQILKIETENNTMYLKDEKITYNGETKNSDELKIPTKRNKHIGTYNNYSLLKNNLLNIEKTKSYHEGFFIGLIYCFGAVSKHKVVFTVYEAELKNKKNKQITLQDQIHETLKALKILSYRTIKQISNTNDKMVLYELELNLQTRKKFLKMYHTYVNQLTNSLVLHLFVKDKQLCYGFLNSFLERTIKNIFRTDRSKVVKQLYFLLKFCGLKTIISKDKFCYEIKVLEQKPATTINGICHQEIFKITEMIDDVYEIIPYLNSENNIFITPSEILLNKKSVDNS